MAFEYEIVVDGRVLVIFLKGKLLIGEGVDVLRNLSKICIDVGMKDVILDTSGLKYMDSTGLGELVRTYTEFRKEFGSITLNNVDGAIKDLLSVTRLITVFKTVNIDYSKKSLPKVTISDLKYLKNVIKKNVDLFALLLTISEDRISVIPARHEGIFFVEPDKNLNKSNLIIASPYSMTKIFNSFFSEEIDEFEYLLNSSKTKEIDLQKFFEKHPQFILSHDYQELYPQIVLDRFAKGPLIPDFLLKPYGTPYCDILEIKGPREKVFLSKKNRPRYSATVFEAISQLREYSDYFEEHLIRKKILIEKGITAYKPKLSLIIGRKSDLSIEETKKIEAGQTQVKILTYDDLLERSKRLLL